MGKNYEVTDCGMIIGASQGGLSILEAVDLLGFSHGTVSKVCNECCEKQKAYNRHACVRMRC